ncbi:MAG TPA: methionine gamma-lyase [Bacteroidales bacterium]|nr:MAG: methionine gamma-lyase [Bacteroidetes bacterium GWF2_33_38]OFY74801.1 MAG: methionine gamma-lyase [Bacteroidetes bacterium RIFOXYA12_FULL_33_9]OFY89916.1 MAG: methionine gamma-lyase [Bacteroidetes bacterium RIFOXYA2_FULL_33_7]HBF88823.1 methionine gamma-lyase [Bacteroidales bacterium]
METKNLGFDTKLIHAGDFHDENGSAVVPIYQTSTFAFKSSKHGADLFAGKEEGYIYTRIGNPTINALENKLAELENGYRGIALASGMAAVSTVYMALLAKGDHMISTGAVYGPSRGVMETHFAKFGVESTYVDTSDLSNIEKAIRPNTKLLYLETPANPTIQLTDIKKASDLAHKHGIKVVVDNTFCSPYLQKPLDLGADVSLHSLTKFINGHADIVGGAIIAKEKSLYDIIRKTMIYMGGNMDPHQAYLVIRGVKTLSLRIDRAQENAMKVAEFLENNPKVAWVKYPGLKSFAQHELAKEQMRGFGSMISFELKGGFAAGEKLMDNVHLATLAVSLGGVESLIQHPASMTHAGISRENKLAAGITDGLVRYSVGIEDVNDIINDLKHGLEYC